MGIPLTVFSLYRLDGVACEHYLLLRVHQPAFSNADAGSYDLAVRVADARRDVLIRACETTLGCAGAHTVHLDGELQARPTGDALSEGPAGGEVNLWVARTRYGPPWVVLGTAECEDAFWREVEEHDDLAALRPIRPAIRRRARFLADDEGTDGDADPGGALIA